MQANGGVPQATTATVYRDTNGVPHIVADNEATAWFALGYEQARDGLIYIQFACKAAKGELTWARGFSGWKSDFAVKAIHSYERIAALTLPQRRALFAPTNPSIQSNFYDNCVAYAQGADSFRQAVKNAQATSPLTPERRLRNWLDNNKLPLAPNGIMPNGQPTFAWVYQDPITATDIAAQGPSTSAIMSLWFPDNLVNSSGGSFGLQAGSAGEAAEPVGDPLAPGYFQSRLDELRQRLSSLPGAPSAFLGSNTFAWSRLYCVDAPPGNAVYAGLLGDPHQPVSGDADFNAGLLKTPNHLWFAHVKVTPPGASQPSLDLLGHFPYAAAAPFTSHNRDIAMGGTLGAPNVSDTFLVRLEEGAGGQPATPRRFYSYYHDPANTNTAWRYVTDHFADIKSPVANVILHIPYWRVESFGIVTPRLAEADAYVLSGQAAPTGPPVIFGSRVVPTQPAPPWRASVPAPPAGNPFWGLPQYDAAGQLTTSPMLVAVRAPIDTDTAIPNADMHLKLLRDFWELGHLTQVTDLLNSKLTNGAAYVANVCFVDRQGRIFTTVMSAIPERGDDAALFAGGAGYHTLDKWSLYSRAFGPVPARHYQDRRFDWRFAPTGGVTYLQHPTVWPPAQPFKAITLQDQLANNAFPPRIFTPGSAPFRTESSFFASACNDLVWGFSRRRDDVRINPNAPNAFSNYLADNQMLQVAMDRGCVYQSPILTFEAPSTQQIVVSRLTKVAERIYRGYPAGLPPMTPAEMRAFVVTPALHRDDDYVAPNGMASQPARPTPIRQLKEVADYPYYTAPAIPATPTTPAVPAKPSPLVSAQKELRFFDDLWRTLYSSAWNSHVVAGSGTPSIMLSLRDLWIGGNVTGHVNQVFWYDNPTNQQNPGLRWIDMPSEFPLIDFVWMESDVGQSTPVYSVFTPGTATTPGVLSTNTTALASAVSELVAWDAPGTPGAPTYANVPSSPGACLLEMMRQGLNAQGATYGRHWVRLRRGQVQTGPTTWVPLTASGQIPGGSGSTVKMSATWGSSAGLLFSFYQHSTLFGDSDALPVPYDALYDNAGLVRAALSPEHTNKLVEFFLRLGSYYIEPSANNGNPSRKLARYQLNGSNEARFVEAKLLSPYPLTDGLQRLMAVRALLDTTNYLQSISPSGTPPFSQLFRSRAYDQTGQIWPALPTADVACVGGALRAVGWTEDSGAAGYAPGRGFQPKFLSLGGSSSIATMMALFPSVGTTVDSYFWCTPGIELMTFDPRSGGGFADRRFDAHMNAFSTNTLLPTYYDTFLNHVGWTVIHSY